MQIVINIDEKDKQEIDRLLKGKGLALLDNAQLIKRVVLAVLYGTSLTSDVLADALMEERIRGKLDSDTIFEKDIIPNVKCRLTVSIRDHRPCYCGAELREVWRESEDNK